jgi:MoaF-like
MSARSARWLRKPHHRLAPAKCLRISLPTFTPRITNHSDRELTVEIVAGDNSGFFDTVEYEAVEVRDGLVVLSWQETHRKHNRARA